MLTTSAENLFYEKLSEAARQLGFIREDDLPPERMPNIQDDKSSDFVLRRRRTTKLLTPKHTLSFETSISYSPASDAILRGIPEQNPSRPMDAEELFSLFNQAGEGVFQDVEGEILADADRKQASNSHKRKSPVDDQCPTSVDPKESDHGINKLNDERSTISRLITPPSVPDRAVTPDRVVPPDVHSLSPISLPYRRSSSSGLRSVSYTLTAASTSQNMGSHGKLNLSDVNKSGDSDTKQLQRLNTDTSKVPETLEISETNQQNLFSTASRRSSTASFLTAASSDEPSSITASPKNKSEASMTTFDELFRRRHARTRSFTQILSPDPGEAITPISRSSTSADVSLLGTKLDNKENISQLSKRRSSTLSLDNSTGFSSFVISSHGSAVSTIPMFNDSLDRPNLQTPTDGMTGVLQKRIMHTDNDTLSDTSGGGVATPRTIMTPASTIRATSPLSDVTPSVKKTSETSEKQTPSIRSGEQTRAFTVIQDDHPRFEKHSLVWASASERMCTTFLHNI